MTLRTASLLLMSILFGQLSFSQVLKGRVSDHYGNPLPGASLGIISKNTKTLSDSSGRFIINAVKGDVISVSFVGYNDITWKSDGSEEHDFIMTPNSINLDEVILVGYGSQKRKDITGATARVNVKEFNPVVTTNPLLQIQGKVAGLVLIQSGSDPNGDLVIRLRGATSIEGQPPLIVIDGIAIDDAHKALATINPSDIQSYDILKDASASAIYGARGANGVILITTKLARKGKTLIEYDGFIGTEQLTRKLDLLTADEWRKATSNMNSSSLDAGGNENWQETVTRNAIKQNHSLSISGGNDQLSIRGSLGYLEEQGMIVNSGRKSINGRINVNQKAFNEKLQIQYGLNLSNINRDFLPDQTDTKQARLGGNYISGYAPKFLPVWPEYNADGSYYIPPSLQFNPSFIVHEVYSKQHEDFSQGSIIATYEIIRDLKFGFLAAISKSTDNLDRFLPEAPNITAPAQATKSNFNKQNFSGDLHLNYIKKFDKHRIDLTGVYEYNKFMNDGFGVTATGFLVPELLTNNLGAANSVQTNNIFSFKNEVRLISFLARAVYSFNDKYILTANFRRDGSSKFGPNNRWGNFPSLALAWRLDQESFVNSVKWIDNLKLRVSYGLTGNQENIDPYSYQQLYAPAGPYLYNQQIFQSYAVVQENNPDLKWEVRKSFNIGLDFSILKGVIYGSADVFNDKTEDMLYLYGIPQPPFLTDKVLANAADATNKGIELTLGAIPVRNKNFSWNINATFATLRNRVTNLLGQFKGVDLNIPDPSFGYAYGGAFGATPVTRLSIGYPVGVFWLPEHAGIDAEGRELFSKYDTDGKLIGTDTAFTDQDRTYTDPTPDFTWGISSRMEYRNFDFSFLIRGIKGQKIFNNTLLQFENINYLPGSNITRTGLTNGFRDLPQASSYWLQDGSFARLDNLTLGYSFKKLKGPSSLRVYLTATNLFVITPYKGNDPEITADGRQRYIDLNVYPRTRGFTFGIHAGF